MRVLHYAPAADVTLHSSHPAGRPTALLRPGLVRQEHLPRLENIKPPVQGPETVQEDEMNWMDELEQHIVQTLMSENASSDVAVDDGDSTDDEEDMEIIDLTPPKPSLPTRTESIPIPMFTPPSSPPPSDNDEAERDDEGQDAEDDDDEEMSDAYSSSGCPSFAAGRHHGYSRSALHNLKEFWSSRHDEWIKFNAYNTSKAYDGIIKSPRPSLRLDTSFLHNSSTSNNSSFSTPALSPSSTTSEESQSTASRTPSPSLDPNSPIFPRVGDISRLRDPRPAVIDRAFCHVPLYSISKMLFTHEIVQVKSPSPDDSSVCGGGGNDISSMSVYSDDSTLVEEETLSGKKGEVDWFGRWRFIVEKLGGRLDRDGTVIDKSLLTVEDSMSWDEDHQTRSRPMSPGPRKFFFALEDNDFSDRDFDEDEDEDDYGCELSKGNSPYGRVSVQSLEREYLNDYDMHFQ